MDGIYVFECLLIQKNCNLFCYLNGLNRYFVKFILKICKNISPMLLAKRIKLIRQCKCISQKSICDYMGIEQSTYSGYETEAGNLQFKTIVAIAEALGCSVPFLVDIQSNIYDYEAWKSGPH